MTEPTEQPPAGPSAMPAAATRREARLRREALTRPLFDVPPLAAPLVAPDADAPAAPTVEAGARTIPLPLPPMTESGTAPAALAPHLSLAAPLVTPAPLAEPAPSPRREARQQQAATVLAAEPIDPATADGSAPRRRRAVVWSGIAAALVLIAGLGSIGPWLLRAPEPPAAEDQHVDAPPNPIAGRGLEGAGSPSASAPPRTPPPPPANAIPPVETAIAPIAGDPVDPVDTGDTGDTGSSAPAPAPAPVPGDAGPAPAPPAAPAPLAFTGLTRNETVGLLGIRLLQSYTLSLTGQPGSAVSVTYRSTNVGSVTFDGSGRASLTFGEGLVALDLGDPLVRAAYTDGTPGEPIEARRSDI
ncbi:hypothetical protein [Microbacterium sp. 22242]|uniref:hypothetical protein n=1 Tax=Microbacterium sp. 22242 TaxID=3453896 RepID=UPI003F8319D0